MLYSLDLKNNFEIWAYVVKHINQIAWSSIGQYYLCQYSIIEAILVLVMFPRFVLQLYK